MYSVNVFFTLLIFIVSNAIKLQMKKTGHGQNVDFIWKLFLKEPKKYLIMYVVLVAWYTFLMVLLVHDHMRLYIPFRNATVVSIGALELLTWLNYKDFFRQTRN